MLAFKITLGISIVAIIILVDLYSWQAIKTILRNKKSLIRPAKWVHYSTTVIAIAIMLLTFSIRDLEINKLYRVFSSAFIFMVYLSKIFACLFLLVDDIRRLIKWIIRLVTPKEPVPRPASESSTSNKISRSEFISKTAVVAAAAPLVLLSKGMIKGAYDYQIFQQKLYLPNLPPAFEGLRILQISDVHSGSFFDKDAVHRGIKMITDAKADLIFFTGDLVNSKTDEAYEYTDIFSEIKAPMGVFSIFGNHDYGDYLQWPSEEAKKRNLEDLVHVHHDLGWHLMRNENVTLEKEGQRIGLLGVENWGDRGRFQKFGDIDKAKKGLPDVPVKLLLSHDPSHFDAVVLPSHPDIDVMFSGHTHGFQMGIETPFFRWSPSQYIYPRWAGLYKANQQQLYVNRGFGFLGYPGRVGILPEITVFELVRS